MDETMKIVLAIIGSVLASSGFWSFINARRCKDTAERRLLKGLAHDRIIYLSNQYLERGDWITNDEYENLYEYLYVPYAACDGNGTAEKLIKEVQTRLKPVRDIPYEYQKAREERRIRQDREFSVSGGL